MVELKKIGDLFMLCHKLVEMQPENEKAWYAVGCYYHAAGQYSTAKKFFSQSTLIAFEGQQLIPDKAVSINPSFGEGWVAQGHALYAAEEHEQALNSYLRVPEL